MTVEFHNRQPAASPFLLACASCPEQDAQGGRVQLMQYCCGERLSHMPMGLFPSCGTCAAVTSPCSCVQPRRVSPSLCQHASACPWEDDRPRAISRGLRGCWLSSSSSLACRFSRCAFGPVLNNPSTAH